MVNKWLRFDLLTQVLPQNQLQSSSVGPNPRWSRQQCGRAYASRGSNLACNHTRSSVPDLLRSIPKFPAGSYVALGRGSQFRQRIPSLPWYSTLSTFSLRSAHSKSSPRFIAVCDLALWMYVTVSLTFILAVADSLSRHLLSYEIRLH